MKTNIKFLSLMLVLTLLLSVTPVFAAEGDQTVPVDLTVEEPIFSVTVPLSLPITIDEAGDIITATDISIINNSAGPVVITDIQTRGANEWELVEYGTLDMSTAQVGSKNVSLSLELDGTTILTTGTNTNNFAGFIRIAKDASLPILYDAEVPAQKTTQVGTQIAEVIFTIGWDE